MNNEEVFRKKYSDLLPSRPNPNPNPILPASYYSTPNPNPNLKNSIPNTKTTKYEASESKVSPDAAKNAVGRMNNIHRVSERNPFDDFIVVDHDLIVNYQVSDGDGDTYCC